MSFLRRFFLESPRIEPYAAPRWTPSPVAEPQPVEGDSEADRIRVYLLSAMARGDASLSAYTATRDPQLLVDGILDMRYRLAQGDSVDRHVHR